MSRVSTLWCLLPSEHTCIHRQAVITQSIHLHPWHHACLLQYAQHESSRYSAAHTSMGGGRSWWKGRLLHAAPAGQDLASQWMKECLFRQSSPQPSGTCPAGLNAVACCVC